MKDPDAFVPPPALCLLEIWRPTWLGAPPHTFYRECKPGAFAGSFTHGPWCLFGDDVWQRVRALPNHFFTIDEKPGVTFAWRKVKHPSWEDREAVRALWRAARERPTAAEVAELPGT